MAVTVDPLTNGDFTRINRADSTANWTDDGSIWRQIALNTSSQVENTGCVEGRVQAGIGSLVSSFTSRSFENVHIRMWQKLAQSVSPGATYGARLIIGTEGTHGSWVVYDDAKQVVVYNGWMMMVIDPRKPFDGTSGTPPSILTATSFGCRTDFVDGNGKVLPLIDMLWEGNEVSIEGGTTGARGTFAEWSTDDRTNGYGILRDVGGVYYLNAGAVFQGVGTANSFFEDINQVIVFEDLPVSGSLYKVRHVGNATGTNHFQLGTSSGAGVDKEGSAGGVWRAGGAAPFHIEAIDTNIDVAAYFGVTMLGPDALYDDQVRNYKFENPVSTYTDDTLDANDAGLNDFSLVNATANTSANFGHDDKFYEVNLDVGTAGVGTYTITWEYYNGTAFVALTDVTDGTSNFKTAGLNTVTYAIPDDWARGTFGGDNRYWIRGRRNAGTMTTVPLGDSCTVAMAGDIRWEDPAAEMIGCSQTGMGSIRLRNGAFLKKGSIGGSNVGAKHAAVDLGSADPTADTFRDMIISGNTGTNGILLKGTSTGATTYNFRNITLGNNLKHVRVDFPGAATITINVLEGGTGFTASDVNNLNSSALVINAGVTTTINVDDDQGADLNDVRVLVRAAAGGPRPFNVTVTITRVTTVATVAHTAHGYLVGDKSQIKGITDKTEDNAVQTVVTVPNVNSYTYTTTNSGSTNYTGTIKDTAVFIDGVTAGVGTIADTRTFASDQPISGFIRKSSVSPRFKTFPLSGNTISSTGGLTINVRLILDE